MKFIQLIVSDMARTLAFYRRLDLDLPAAADTETHVAVELAGGVSLVWDTEEVHRSYLDWTPPPGGPGRVKLGFLLDDPEALDKAYANLVGAGHPGRVAPADIPWGDTRYAVVQDPDGNDVDLYAYHQR